MSDEHWLDKQFRELLDRERLDSPEKDFDWFEKNKTNKPPSKPLSPVPFNPDSYKDYYDPSLRPTGRVFYGDDFDYFQMDDGSLISSPDPKNADVGWDNIEQARKSLKEQSGIELFEYNSDTEKKRFDKYWSGGEGAKESARFENWLKESAEINLEKQKELARQLKLDKMKEIGLKVVKRVAPKLPAVMGGPIGIGIAAGSTLLDAADAYALTEKTVNPQTPEDFARQKALAELMKRNEFY